MEPMMMFPAVINSNSTCMTDDEVTAASSSVSRVEDFCSLNSIVQPVSVSSSQQPQILIKKKRNLPGNPDPDAEVIALSPKTLLATNRFICEICNKGFQRDQNLQLHRRGHNLPWKLKQRNTKEINKKRAYVCPEPTCVHHHPSRALGDLTGIKKHFSRKHGEKKWMCEKCSKIYAVQSDWKAHTKTCGTREYKCHCGTLFSRKDSFITHRAFCDALAEESARLSANSLFTENTTARLPPPPPPPFFPFTTQQHQHQHLENPSISPMVHNLWNASRIQNPNPSTLDINQVHVKPEAIHFPISTPFNYPEHPGPTPHKSYLGHSSLQVQNLLQSSVPQLSATALLQRASSLGAHSVGHVSSTLSPLDMRNISHMTSGNTSVPPVFGTWQENSDRLTRDFLGLTGEQCLGTGVGMGNGGNVDVNVNVNMRGVLSFTGRVEFPAYERDLSALAPNHHQSFGYSDPNVPATWRNC